MLSIFIYIILAVEVSMIAAQPTSKTKKFETMVAALIKEVSTVNTYCKLLATGTCGPCKCVDDAELQQRYYCDCQNLKPKRDCLEFYDDGERVNGIYLVTMNNLKKMQVYCDMTTDGGGWTVIQRRRDGSINFLRNWNEYKQGFGIYQNEFWLGNQNLYILTQQALFPKGSQLRIDMTDWKGKKAYAKYKKFQVGNMLTRYIMHISGYSGNAGDSLIGHNGMKFSTYDKDHDSASGGHCARLYRAGWWYYSCHDSNLNGEYLQFGQKLSAGRGINWYYLKKSNAYSLKFVEMKVRRNK